MTGGKMSGGLATLVLGETAIKHHVNRTGCFQIIGGELSLTPKGTVNPHWVKANPEHVTGFAEILTTGKTDKALPGSITNQTGIAKL
jgi:hypothetical protein